MDFFNVAAEEIAGFAEDHGVKLEKSFRQEWFLAEDGCKTVTSIIEGGEKGLLDVRVMTDLRKFQKVLEAAKQNGIRWHLAVDF